MLEGVRPVEIKEYYGLNTKQSKARLVLGFSADMHDIDLSSPGIAKTRGGCLTINQFTPPGPAGAVAGTNVGALQLNGVNQYASTPDHSDFSNSSNTRQYNISFNCDDLSHVNVLWSQATDGNNYEVMQVLANGSLQYKVVAAGVTVLSLTSAAGTVEEDEDVHFEICYVAFSGSWYMFKNGVYLPPTVSGSTLPVNYTGAFEIGRLNKSGSEGYFSGHIDEFRFEKNFSSHDADFTDYTEPFTADSATKLLLHFEGDDQQTTTTDSSGTSKAITLHNGAKLHVGLLTFAPNSIADFYKPTTDAHIIIGSGGTKVFTMESSGRWKTVGSGLTSAAVMDFLNYGDKVLMSNAEDAGKAYDGTTFRNWGIVKPANAPTVAAGVAGSLSGTYSYVYTYYNSTTLHESSASALSAPISVTAQKIDLSVLTASPDTQADKIRIYRTTNGGATFFLVDMISSGTTTYTDETTDANLSSFEAPFYNDPPPEFAGLEEFDGRVFGYQRGSTTVEFSNDEFYTPAGTGLPEESFHPDNTIQFNARVMGIKKSPNFNELWVHTTKGVYAVKPTGIPLDPYYAVVRNSTWHTSSHKSIVNIYNDQWFVTASGKFLSIDSSGNVNYESYFIEPTMAEGNKTQFDTIQSCHYVGNSKNQYRTIYPTSGQVTPDVMLAANYLQRTPGAADAAETNDVSVGVTYPVWEYHNIPATCMAVVRDSDVEDVLYTGGLNGEIKKQDFGTNDDGEAIDWSFSIGWSKTAITSDKTLFPRYLEQHFNPLGNYSFTLTTDFDFGSAGGQSYPVRTTLSGARFDFDLIFDSARFAGAAPLQIISQDLGGAYKYVQLTYSGNALDEVFELHSLVVLSREIEGYRTGSGGSRT